MKTSTCSPNKNFKLTRTGSPGYYEIADDIQFWPGYELLRYFFYGHRRWQLPFGKNIGSEGAFLYLRKCGISRIPQSVPIYAYDHGGIAFSTQSFVGRAQHASWDSAQLGRVFLPPSLIRTVYDVKVPRKAHYTRAAKEIEAFFTRYTNAVNGEVYELFELDNNKRRYEDSTDCSPYPVEIFYGQPTRTELIDAGVPDAIVDQLLASIK